MTPSQAWPTDRLQQLWALQKRACKKRNRVYVKDHGSSRHIPVLMVHVVIDGAGRSSPTVDGAEQYRDEEKAA